MVMIVLSILKMYYGATITKKEPKQDDHDYIYYKELIDLEQELDRLTIKDVPQRMQKKLDYYKLLFDDEKGRTKRHVKQYDQQCLRSIRCTYCKDE